MKVRNLFLWRAFGGSTISCVVIIFRQLRHKTITAQQGPEWLIDKLILYILHARSLSNKCKYPPSNCSDGKNIRLDVLVINTTIDKQGAKSIGLKTTGHDKYMVSVCLAAKTDGTKLKPFLFSV